MTLSWKTAGLQVNTTTLANSQIRILVRGRIKKTGEYSSSLGQPRLDKMLTHELHTQQGAQNRTYQNAQYNDPEHRPGQQALHGGHIASVHHLGGILQIAFFGKPEGQKVPDKAQIEAEEAQHQPPFFRNCPARRHSSHRIPPTSPVMGNIQVAATSTKPVIRLVSRKGPFFPHLGHHQHEHRPDQNGINKVGSKPYIGADAAHQHKKKADGNAHRPQCAGGDGGLWQSVCVFPVSND